MKTFLLKSWLLLLLLLVSMGAWARSATVTPTAVSGTVVEGAVTFTTAKNGGTSAPVFSNNAIRLYQNTGAKVSTGTRGGSITFKAEKGYVINKVTIVNQNSSDCDGGTVAYQINGAGSWLGSTTVAKGTNYSTGSNLGATSVEIACFGNSKTTRLYITSITVEYAFSGEIFYESFDSNTGTGGNDDKWSGSIASNTFKSDNTWTTDNASGANQCAKFGASSKLGYAKTPAIAVSGNFILTFKAGAWNGSSESTTLKLSATGATLSASSVTLTKGAWNTYNVDITNATKGFTIKFEGNNASNSRFFLDEVSILKVTNITTADNDFYSLYLDYAVTIPSNVTAYKGKLNGLTLNLEPIEGTIPANTGVLFKTAEAGTANFVACANVAALENNDIKGVAVDTRIADIPESTGKKVLVLGMVDGKVGFAQPAAGATTIAANKAYILVPESAGHAPAVRIFVDEETSIETVKTCEAETGVLYNLQGQRVNANAKGLLIVNGKKVLK